LLRYCPNAVVWHYTYEEAGEIKPIQYAGSIFANLYLRLKYGDKSDAWVVIPMALRILLSKEAFPGSRRMIFREMLKLVMNVPKALIARKKSTVFFPFYQWDYEYHRVGAFLEGSPIPSKQDRVSIITRTYKGRGYLLKQALLSAAHQTWSNLELVVVEDGSETFGELIEEVAKVTQRPIKYMMNQERGRSNAGNLGLSVATGKWCVFLDDDDLLFPEHVEVLANALVNHPHAIASYSPALEVSTTYDQSEYQEISYSVPPTLLLEFSYETLTRHNYMAIQSVLFERQLYLDRGGFDSDVEYLEDWSIMVTLCIKNNFIFVPKLTSLYRVPTDPLLQAKRKKALDDALSVAYVKNKTRLEESGQIKC
jgi:hypothetical protein